LDQNVRGGKRLPATQFKCAVDKNKVKLIP